MNIAKAEISDFPRFEQRAKEFYSSSKFLKGFEMDRFINAWTQLYNSGTGVIYMITDDEGEVLGAIGGVVYPDLYSSELIAVEFFWFVSEKHRGSGLDLYYKFEEWAKGKRADQIRMTHLCDLMPDGLRCLYEEMGFQPIEINYAKELPKC